MAGRAYGIVVAHVIRIDETAVRFRLGPLYKLTILNQNMNFGRTRKPCHFLKICF